MSKLDKAVEAAKAALANSGKGTHHSERHIRTIITAALAALEGDAQPVHADDLAVDRFAAAMKAKLKWERDERGRHGWNDPEVCTVEYLARLLVDHLAKGNTGTFEDVANFAMMLHQRGADPQVLALVATPPSPKLGVAVEALRPFAVEFDRLEKNHQGFESLFNDEVEYMGRKLTIGQLRRAREALSQLEKPGE